MVFCCKEANFQKIIKMDLVVLAEFIYLTLEGFVVFFSS